MELSTIRHIANRRYCYALEEGRFLLKIETKRDDAEEVILHAQDKYLPVDRYDTRATYPMVKIASDTYLDYYEVEITMNVRCLRYYFEVRDRDGVIKYLGNGDFYDDEITDIDRMYNCTQKLKEEERHIVPDWAAGTVVYQIFPARYATTKYVDEKTWYRAPIGGNNDLKGDLRGIINTLDHIVELGVDCIYMTPIFESPSVHKYDTIDYYKIDPGFGTIDDLKELVNKCHENNIKVILDGVFNHTSTRFFAFRDVMEKGCNSSYVNWYYFEDFPVFMGGRDRKPNYLSFSYFGGMPKLNLENEDTKNYFVEVGKYWTRECNIDGWRLDVGDEINHNFMKAFRKGVKEVNSNAFIVGEDWQFGNDYLDGDEWDSIMNYTFFRLARDFIAEQSITATEALNKIGFQRGFFSKPVYNVLWNLIDCHDTPRFLHMAGNDITKQYLAAAMQLLLPGMPMMYYGDEYGLNGGRDPDNRRGMLWDDKKRDLKLFQWYKTLINIRKKYKALTKGEIVYSKADDENGVIIITRKYEDNENTVVFHGKSGNIVLDDFKGRINLLTGEDFDGVLEDYQTLVF